MWLHTVKNKAEHESFYINKCTWFSFGVKKFNVRKGYRKFPMEIFFSEHFALSQVTFTRSKSTMEFVSDH